ncbi:MAG: DUF1292 domain-containing protein [Clostridiales bacterium]|nr:DUF1292 domain-containing protein [Clostridiales bacterium]
MEFEEYIDEVVLLDENGEAERFDHILTFLYEGDRYVALEPVSEEEGEEPDLDEEAELVFMRIERGEDGDSYIPVDNEILLDELFSHFLELMDEIEEEE